MDEFKKFLRYIVPGILFVLELLIILFFSHPRYFGENLEKIIPSANIETSIVSTALLGLLITGGLGVLFGSIYHVLFHIMRISLSLCIFRWFYIDTLRVLKAAEKNKWIQFKNWETNEIIPSDNLTQSGAWRIVTSYWNERLKKETGIIASADDRLKSFSDILHGTGTNLVACLIAIFVFIVCCYSFDFYIILWKSAFISVILLLIHLSISIFVARDYEGVLNNTLARALETEARDTQKDDVNGKTLTPKIIFVSSLEFKRF